MEKVFYDWCELIDLEKDYAFLGIFLQDVLHFYARDKYIEGDSVLSIYELSDVYKTQVLRHFGSRQVLYELYLNPNQLKGFIKEINTNLRLKYEASIGM